MSTYIPSGVDSTSDTSVESGELCVARGRQKLLIVKHHYVDMVNQLPLGLRGAQYLQHMHRSQISLNKGQLLKFKVQYTLEKWPL